MAGDLAFGAVPDLADDRELVELPFIRVRAGDRPIERGNQKRVAAILGAIDGQDRGVAQEVRDERRTWHTGRRRREEHTPARRVDAADG